MSHDFWKFMVHDFLKINVPRFFEIHSPRFFGIHGPTIFCDFGLFNRLAQAGGGGAYYMIFHSKKETVYHYSTKRDKMRRLSGLFHLNIYKAYNSTDDVALLSNSVFYSLRFTLWFHYCEPWLFQASSAAAGRLGGCGREREREKGNFCSQLGTIRLPWPGVRNSDQSHNIRYPYCYVLYIWKIPKTICLKSYVSRNSSKGTQHFNSAFVYRFQHLQILSSPKRILMIRYTILFTINTPSCPGFQHWRGAVSFWPDEE